MKRFVLKSLLYCAPMIVPFVMYVCCIDPYVSGDMGHRGYITFSENYGKFEYPKDNKVINCKHNQLDFYENSVLNIGDSFSQTDDVVISYNYFLAKQSKYEFINLEQHWYNNPFIRFLHMSKTRKLPKIVIIETVERRLIDRLYNVNLSESADVLATRLNDTTSEYRSTPRTLLEKTQEYTKRKLGVKGFESPIKKGNLIKPCFTCEDRESSLYFFVEDIDSIPTDDLILSNTILKLDSLFTYASTMNIDLYILIAADKYDVYQDFIVNNPYPRQDLLDRLFTIYNNSHLINSKDTLYQMIVNDIKDTYWCNNSHWSPIGSEAVAIKVAKRINACSNENIFTLK